MDWCEWFGFSFDPFFDKPLESDREIEKLMVVQTKVKEQMDPLIRQMDRVPFLCSVIGERGVGKSTTMYQSMDVAKRKGHLPVYVGLDHIGLETSKRPVYETTGSLLYEIGVGLVTSIHNLKPQFFAQNKRLLLSLSRYLFLDFEESAGFFPSGKPYKADLFELKRYVLAVLNLLKRERIPALLSIDNLDKVSNLDILRSFFKAPFAQSLFDALRKGGASVLIAMAPPFVRIKKGDKYLGYLAQEIQVDRLSPTQVVELLSKRVNYSNDPPPSNPFENRAMIRVGIEKKGITRDILTEARSLCLKAYQQKLSHIAEEFVEKGLVSFSESRVFYGILDRGKELGEAALELCELVTHPELDVEQVIAAIKNIAEGKQIKVKAELLKTLIDREIVRVGARNKYLLGTSMGDLFTFVQKTGWNVDHFLNWMLKSGTIQVFKDGAPGIGAKFAFDRFGPIPSPSRAYVGIIIGDTRQDLETRPLLQDAVSELGHVKQILDSIGTTSWGNIDNAAIFQRIYWALGAFLTAFFKLYISCATSRTIRIRSFKSFDLIENAIHHFQDEYKVSFKTFYRYLTLRDLMKGLARGGFSPSHSHVKAAFDDFEKILKEFTSIWQRISGNFATLQRMDENYERTRKDVVELTELMGFSIERAEYKRFKVDGERFYRMGLAEFPINEASVEIVRERRIENRLGRIKSHFFLASINPDSRKKAEVKEVLAFIARCSELMRIINDDNADAPTGWPRYLLLYVSHHGFEPGIRAALRSAALPSESEIRTVDYFGLNGLIRQLKPARRIPSEEISEEYIEKLQTQDLEQLLRIRLNTARIIHERFEKSRTILLADMKDFTRRTARDALESAEAIQKMSDTLGNNAKKYGGSGANTEGDSFIATFSKPQLALLAALESIKDFEAYNRDVEEERQIQVRIGVCTGEVLLKGHRPFLGNAVNIAARIMSEAEANQVIVTKDVFDKISAFRNFQFESLGAKKLKGIDKPVKVYQAQLRGSPK